MSNILGKTFWLVGIILVLDSSAWAQSPFFKANIVAGLNFCQVDGDRFGGYNKLGLNGGIGILHEYNEKWSAGFEILYSSKGSKKRIDPKDANPQVFVISSSYVEFPISATYLLPSNPKLSFCAGISVGVNVAGSVDDGVKTDANFKKIEWASQLGGSYRISDNMCIRLRHSLSVLRIGDDYPGGRAIFRRTGLYNRLYMASLVFDL